MTPELTDRLFAINQFYVDEVFPRLGVKELGIMEARQLAADFNLKHGTDIAVHDIFVCVFKIEGPELELITDVAIATQVVLLVIDDCNVELQNPSNKGIFKALKLRRSIAEKVIVALRTLN